MGWGADGWPDCAQRVAWVRRAIVAARDARETPKYWRFTPAGWRELACCWPADVLARRRIFRRSPGENDARLFGLPYFVEPSETHPFELIVEARWDDAQWVRLHQWVQDAEFARVQHDG